jgi:hypothetical protein
LAYLSKPLSTASFFLNDKIDGFKRGSKREFLFIEQSWMGVRFVQSGEKAKGLPILDRQALFFSLLCWLAMLFSKQPTIYIFLYR